jgi:hypothetical protein
VQGAAPDFPENDHERIAHRDLRVFAIPEQARAAEERPP